MSNDIEYQLKKFDIRLDDILNYLSNFLKISEVEDQLKKLVSWHSLLFSYENNIRKNGNILGCIDKDNNLYVLIGKELNLALVHIKDDGLTFHNVVLNIDNSKFKNNHSSETLGIRGIKDLNIITNYLKSDYLKDIRKNQSSKHIGQNIFIICISILDSNSDKPKKYIVPFDIFYSADNDCYKIEIPTIFDSSKNEFKVIY